jgi:predicted RNA-binding protein
VYVFRERHGVVRNDLLDYMIELRKREMKSFQKTRIVWRIRKIPQSVREHVEK